MLKEKFLDELILDEMIPLTMSSCVPDFKAYISLQWRFRYHMDNFSSFKVFVTVVFSIKIRFYLYHLREALLFLVYLNITPTQRD